MSKKRNEDAVKFIKHLHDMRISSNIEIGQSQKKIHRIGIYIPILLTIILMMAVFVFISKMRIPSQKNINPSTKNTGHKILKLAVVTSDSDNLFCHHLCAHSVPPQQPRKKTLDKKQNTSSLDGKGRGEN